MSVNTSMRLGSMAVQRYLDRGEKGCRDAFLRLSPSGRAGVSHLSEIFEDVVLCKNGHCGGGAMVKRNSDNSDGPTVANSSTPTATTNPVSEKPVPRSESSALSAFLDARANPIAAHARRVPDSHHPLVSTAPAREGSLRKRFGHIGLFVVLPRQSFFVCGQQATVSLLDTHALLSGWSPPPELTRNNRERSSGRLPELHEP